MGLQLEEYRVSMMRSDLIGLGLFGAIGCVTAGALEKSPDLLQNAFWVALFVAAGITGGSRLYVTRQARNVRQRIREGKPRSQRTGGAVQ